MSAEEAKASWAPVYDAFDVDFYDKVPNVAANSLFGSLSFAGSEWLPRQKYRRRVDGGRSKIRDTATDEEIATALRNAMDHTHS